MVPGPEEPYKTQINDLQAVQRTWLDDLNLFFVLQNL